MNSDCSQKRQDRSWRDEIEGFAGKAWQRIAVTDMMEEYAESLLSNNRHTVNDDLYIFGQQSFFHAGFIQNDEQGIFYEFF